MGTKEVTEDSINLEYLPTYLSSTSSDVVLGSLYCKCCALGAYRETYLYQCPMKLIYVLGGKVNYVLKKERYSFEKR